MRRRWWWPAWLFAAILMSACAEPPNKEMDLAQRAIEAAQAAGADRYAADDYRAATDALEHARGAVRNKDYRLALNHALDSRDRAQTAARAATEARDRLRSEVERTLAGMAPPLADAHARLAAAEKARAPRKLLRQATAALSAVDSDVQKAGEALKAGDYPAAQSILKDVRGRITEATALIARATPASAGRRRR